MKPILTCSRSPAKILILANAALWLAFTTYYVAQSYSWQPHKQLFEEPSPPYIFWGRAFPFEEYMSPFMRATRFVEAPSVHVATVLFQYLASRDRLADDLYAGVSMGGYHLVVVCVLSFAQWCLAGLLIAKLRQRFGIVRFRRAVARIQCRRPSGLG